MLLSASSHNIQAYNSVLYRYIISIITDFNFQLYMVMMSSSNLSEVYGNSSRHETIAILARLIARRLLADQLSQQVPVTQDDQQIDGHEENRLTPEHD